MSWRAARREARAREQDTFAWIVRARELAIAIADLTHNHGVFPHTCPMARGWIERLTKLADEAYQAGQKNAALKGGDKQ